MGLRAPSGKARSRNLTLIKQLRDRSFRQAAIARLGEKALTGSDGEALFDEAARLVGQTLAVDSCTVLDVAPEHGLLRWRAGFGAKPTQLPGGLVSDDPTSHFAYAYSTSRPLVVEDFAEEDRVHPPLVLDGVLAGSGVAVVIPGPERALGVLGAHSTVPRGFSEEDVSFLQAMANVLGTALERRRTEQAALHLAAVVQSSEDAIIGKTLDGIITSWNAGAERLYGYRADEAIGRPISIIIPTSRPHEMRSILDRLRRGEQIQHFETTRVRKDGGEVNVSVSISPLRGNDGQLAGASTIARDITERRRVEETLRSTNNQLRIYARIVDGLPDLVAVVDRARAYRMVNPAYGRAFDTAPEELIGRRMTDVVRDVPFLELVEARLEQCFEGNSLSQEAWWTFPSGVRRYYHVSFHPLLGPVGADLAVIVARDATERRRTEQFREEFLNLAAHELRTPLTTLKGYAQILQKRGGHDEEEERLFRSVGAQVDRLSHLVQTVIDVSQIQTGEMTLLRRSVDLVALASEIVAELSVTAPRHRLKLEAPAALEVIADAKRIREVIFSLVDNAVKYSPRGGTVEVCVERKGEDAVFRVKDQGIGIAVERQAELFQAFFQVAPMVSPTSGMGLGLFISREIVRRHGGQIWFESEEGKGSSFAFSLPIHTESS